MASNLGTLYDDWINQMFKMGLVWCVPCQGFVESEISDQRCKKCGSTDLALNQDDMITKNVLARMKGKI